MAPSAPKVLIIHPFMPAYRVPLVLALGDRLRELGGELTYVESEPPPSLASRGDRRTTEYGAVVRTRWLSVGRKEVAFRSLRPIFEESQPNLVVVEQALKNLETYPMFAQLRRAKTEMGMWGHGRSYSTRQTELEAAAKQWLTRRTKWFFSYTQAGADHVVRRGFPRVRTTVLNNTIDTAELRRDLESVSTYEVETFRSRLGLTEGKTALFIGGVDDSKGLSFLINAAPKIAQMMPGFVLLVAGDGKSRGDVQAAELRGGPIRFLGRVDGHEKALALRAADVLTIPEWIGLVAVDSLVAGRPIVTTHHDSHSPEHEYLEDGLTCVYSPHDVDKYSVAVSRLLLDAKRLDDAQRACVVRSADFSIERMTDAFVEGLMTWDEFRRFGL